MNKNFKLLVIIFGTIWFCSCIFSAVDIKIIDGYFLSANDVDEQLEIVLVDSQGYSFQIVAPTVVAVGHNNEYIIAQQQKKESNINSKLQMFNYYIIPIDQNPSAASIKNKIGPLSKAQFEIKKKEMKIQVSFSDF